VVVVPDEVATLGGLDETIEKLVTVGVPLRIDPVLEPIGLGMAASLARYHLVRQRWPDTEMMMGIGNLTELTDVDSAGINVLLLAFCQELEIRSVLTTQVINWARSSVHECDRARRLVHYAVQNQVVAKHLEPGLVMLRDTKLYEQGPEQLARWARQLRDNNYRLLAEGGRLHLIGAGIHLQDTDPFVLFERLMATGPENVDPSHAFYLGYELSKALTALTLGKQYRQDESLDWGILTVPEPSPRPRRSGKSGPPAEEGQ
jgi:dihydropteroate synthase